MPEQLVLDPTHFSDYATTTLDSMRRVVTTKKVVDQKGGAKGLQLNISDGRQGNEVAPTVIIPRGYQAFEGDGFEDQRDRVLAAILGARVIGIDTPGVSLYTDSAASIQQRYEAVRGRMRRQAASQLAAAMEVIDYKGETLDFVGHSLGTWSVAEMVSLPGSTLPVPFKIGRIDLIEAVNDQSWSLIGKDGLLRRIGAEDEATDRYLADNVPYNFKQPFDRDYPDYTAKNSENKLPLRLQSLLLGYGMRKPFAPILSAALQADRGEKVSGLSDAPLHFWRGNGSRVARPDANQATIEELARYTREVRLTTLANPANTELHRHPFWHSMPAVAIWATMRQAYNA